MITKLARRANVRVRWLLATVAVCGCLILPAMALAGRSGGSFGGRSGFRSGGGFSMPRSSSPGGYGNRYGGGGHSFFFFPGFGFGGYGGGFGGFGLFGTLMIAAVVGVAVVSVVRAVRQHRQSQGLGGGWGSSDEYDEPGVMPGRAYVYRLQLGLGRSARGIQQRLEQFAASGDTATESGLAHLAQQTALELLREKDSIRYAGGEASGPMSLVNAENKLNGLTLGERSRFQVERVRAVDGRVNRSEAAAEEGKEALEYVLVTLLVATRTPVDGWRPIQTPADLTAVLSGLGGLSPDGLLGLEVIWTPADANDSMTETDLMTGYPDLRSL
ncbi:MAG TPA: DUF1517 domain-containing protein [Polyangia bacterium]|nr:DUF1517 domain-containing protein [Polyangia bacterium]